MKKQLFVAQLSDLQYLKENFYRIKDDFSILYFDPYIYDLATKSGLSGDLIKLNLPHDYYAIAQKKSQSMAMVVDLEMSLLRRKFFQVESGLTGWDHFLIYYFFLRLEVYSFISKALIRATRADNLYLLKPQNPQNFYFDSFLSVELFEDLGCHVLDSYNAAHNWRPNSFDYVPNFNQILSRLSKKDCVAITHIPTCFHQKDFFLSQISEAYQDNIDIPSFFWDVPVRRREIDKLIPIDQFATHKSFSAPFEYKEQYVRLIDTYMAPYIKNDKSRKIQSLYMAKRAYHQAVTYRGLMGALQNATVKPDFILSDHDVGINGPLFSVAENFQANIYALPHSQYIANLLPHSQNVTAVQFNGFNMPVKTVLGESVRVKNISYHSASAFYPRKKIKKICLLLNSLFSNGISYIDMFSLIEVYKKINFFCLENQIELILRLKPSGSAVNLVSRILDIPLNDLTKKLEMSIEDVANDVDLCIAYGEPTTAIETFLNSGALVIHIWEQKRLYADVSPWQVFYSDAVNSISCEDLIELIYSYLDPDTYLKDLNRQYSLREKIPKDLMPNIFC